MQNSAIGWVGGKSLIRSEILERMPEHTTYVEVFCGAAWVLFGKDPSTSAVEVLNDRHSELTNFFRCVRERPLELIDRIKFRLLSQDDVRDWREGGHQRQSEVERAATFFWLLKVAFGGRTVKPSFGYRLDKNPHFRPELVRDIIKRAYDRLRRVGIFSEDFCELIPRLDRSGTFFYCDPPYWNYESCYEERFTKESHRVLAELLGGIKGKFLLSYNDHPEIRALYDWATIETVSTKYSCGTRPECRQRSVTELLIRSYER